MKPQERYREKFRPQFHFSPPEKWMNDPNGLVYVEGVYHLFYQYYPEDVVWGPMHWGHAVSDDLLHWEHKPIALYPDDLGYIFSGSAVFDKHNTSGLGTEAHPPLVAFFTYHNTEKEAEGRKYHQTQGIAYSLDGGDTWEKYPRNPVIDNDEFPDFRDPKVFWDNDHDCWFMLLVAGDHLRIYRSEDLVNWTWLSEFGRDEGAHGGVWECPDMFKLKAGDGTEKWVLLISINPGGPNGGSATQYFIGDFDGVEFTTSQEEEKWVDWGADNYAGVTFNHAPGGKRLFIGWMGNWNYAAKTPTEGWRGAMTLPRELRLHLAGTSYELGSYPVSQFDDLRLPVEVGREKDAEVTRYTARDFNAMDIIANSVEGDQNWEFSNASGDTLLITLDTTANVLALDRRNSGYTDFDPSFAQEVQTALIPNLPDSSFEVRLIIDACSVEIFLNSGQYSMTSLVFPQEPYNTFSVFGKARTTEFSFQRIRRVW